VLICSNTAVSLVRGVVNTAVRLPAFVMIIAALTTCIELLMQAFTYELYQILGIFIPLITTNCVILGRADGFAAKNGIARSAFDGLMMGIGFGLVLVVLGAVRELLGTGMLFANMQLLFGPLAENWQLTLFSDYKGFLLAILPPGAFLVLGLMIAGKNIVDQRAEARAKASAPAPEPVPSRRVRVTGVVE
jgi:electron transport complex protein RnfE